MIGPHSTLFLDRDGVINAHPSKHYIHSWDEFYFIPGVLSAIAKLGALFPRIAVTTNQQGVGKELMTHEDVRHIHNKMLQAIHGFGGRIDYVAYCPDLKTDPSHGRKPRPNMAYEVRDALGPIDFKNSIMVGDQLTDLQFGAILGMKTVHVHNNAKDSSFLKRFPSDYAFDNLSDCAEFLIKHHEEVFTT